MMELGCLREPNIRSSGALLFLVALCTSLPGARSHGALVFPPARNAFDGSLPRFTHGQHSECACGDPVAGCDLGNRQGMGGQPCYWFSQGCFIGCANCTGTDIQHNGMPSAHGPHASCAPSKQPAGATSQPTLPKRLWTMNRGAIEFSEADIYRFHPWRAPGSAPVEDACGMAGGTTPQFAGPGNAVFESVSLNGSTIAQGDLGSAVLPLGAPVATWRIGSAVEVRVDTG